jgi:hypothetical protein
MRNFALQKYQGLWHNYSHLVKGRKDTGEEGSIPSATVAWHYFTFGRIRENLEQRVLATMPQCKA